MRVLFALKRWSSPQLDTPTGWESRWSAAGGRLRSSSSTAPWLVPTIRQGPGPPSVTLRGNVSQKWKEEMTSRDSRSMLVTLELRERLKELSLASG